MFIVLNDFEKTIVSLYPSKIARIKKNSMKASSGRTAFTIDFYTGRETKFTIYYQEENTRDDDYTKIIESVEMMNEKSKNEILHKDTGFINN